MKPTSLNAANPDIFPRVPNVPVRLNKQVRAGTYIVRKKT